VAGLQHDAAAEGATLALVDGALAFGQLDTIVSGTGVRQDRTPPAQTEIRRWSRDAGSPARDGVPAHAFAAGTGQAAGPGRPAGRLAQRDFDLGRGLGLLTPGGAAPPVTAVLLTSGDGRADWLAAGQALHRLLLRAASRWIFASLYSQPLEAAAVRELIQQRLPDARPTDRARGGGGGRQPGSRPESGRRRVTHVDVPKVHGIMPRHPQAFGKQW
jgi:hypothetical protein